MNRPEGPGPIELDSAIDRLVDGGLDAVERRELLLKLEATPDGWRRCALAFLEDQAWREALAVPRSAEVARPLALVAAPKVRQGWARAGRGLAASLVAAAFAAGFAAGGMSKGRSGPPVVAVAPAPGRPVQAPAPAPLAAEDSIRRVGYVDLVDRSAGEAPPQRVPVLSGPGLDEEWLQEQGSPVPEYVRARWERQGFQVEERRRLVPLALTDGRQVSIPIDEVALEYVGRQPL